MDNFTSEMVDDLADKLLIGLTRDENKMVLDEFDIIDKNIDESINGIKNLDKVEPMSFCLDDFYAVLRDDVACESISSRDLLSNCDDSINGEVRVPKVVD